MFAFPAPLVRDIFRDGLAHFFPLRRGTPLGFRIEWRQSARSMFIITCVRRAHLFAHGYQPGNNTNIVRRRALLHSSTFSSLIRSFSNVVLAYF